jgi:hypothetical protein
LPLELIGSDPVTSLSEVCSQRFLQRTQSFRVELVEDADLLESTEPRLTGNAQLALESYYLDTRQDVDGMCSQWLPFTKVMVLDNTTFSVDAWNHLWQSPIWQTNRSCTTLIVESGSVGGKNIDHHLDIALKGPWVLDRVQFKSEEVPGLLVAKRTLPSISNDALSYFRPNDNPLICEYPPLDARQSVILEAILRASNDRDQLYNLSKVYSSTLLAPMTTAARTHDVETSVIELRALGIDHQATVDMLLGVINGLQQQRAQDSKQLQDLVRITRSLEEEQEQLNRQQRRQEIRMRELEEENNLLRFKQTNATYYDSSSDEVEDDE